MFGMSYLLSTIILCLLSFIIIVFLALPNISKLKNFHWFLIKTTVIIFITIWIIVLPEEIHECYFYIGGSYGLGFLIRGFLTKKGSKYVFHIFAYSAFSVIFLAVNQKFLFIMNMSLSYILYLGLLFFNLNINPLKDAEVTDGRGSKFVINTIIVIAFASLFGFLVFSVLDGGMIDVTNNPLASLFAFHTEYLTMLTVIIIAMFFALILVLTELYTQSKTRDDEQWYI
ncbi:MAG: hypothetical protein ACTSQC_04190 [Candidatus Heimdallarchaeaceae archaeon]